MDTQKKNLNHKNLNNSMKYKKDSFSQTLINSNHFILVSKEKKVMSNEDYINFFYRKEQGYLKLEKLDKSNFKNKIRNHKRKKRRELKKKNENNAFELFKEEFKKSNPNLSKQDFNKNSKEIWKQMCSSLKNIYFKNTENDNIPKKEV
jgi:hypothetical protein